MYEGINKIQDLYFDWMGKLAIDDDKIREKYSNLLFSLASTTFYFTIPLDENRYKDGIELRYRFGAENGLSAEYVQEYLDFNKCSVLEMMVALCLKCEEQITYDPDKGSQLSDWFLEMLESLGLDGMDDDNFDQNYVDYKIEKLLNREYKPNGEGSLFTIYPSSGRDMRKVEIWNQMCLFLDSLLIDNF